MAVMRVERTDNYTVMANYHLRDKRLSLKAKGLLSVMLSLPPEWDFTLTGLAYISKEGVDAIRAGVKELENCGYVTRKRLRNRVGQLVDTEYTIYEVSQKKEVEKTCESKLLIHLLMNQQSHAREVWIWKNRRWTYRRWMYQRRKLQHWHTQRK